MRPWESHEARPEPIAIEIEKIARKAVTTSSLPPSVFFTRGGISDSTTAPMSQNQLDTTPPHHRRESLHRWRRSSSVERAMLGSTTRSGAPWPVRRMSRLVP